MFDDDNAGGGSGGPQVLETFRFNFAVDGQQDDRSGDQTDEFATDTAFDEQPATAPDPSSLIPGRQHDTAALASRLFPASLASHPPARFELTPTFSPWKLPAPAASSSDLASITRHSDVVPSVYEGGYKLWECAVDLCRHLHRLKHSAAPPDCSRVLELGCGHGLCGLWALTEGSSGGGSELPHVTFHDLNPEVIDDLTAPTVALNLQKHHTPPLQPSAAVAELVQRASFLSGDWSSPSLLSLLPARSHSLVLTSDTLYHASSIPPLLRLIQHTLAATGTALVASKRYYFGVGGGTVELTRRVERDGRMECEVVEVIEDGQSNIREVVRLRWKDWRIQDGAGETANDSVAMAVS